MGLPAKKLLQQKNDESPWYSDNVNFLQLTAQGKAARGQGAVIELGYQLSSIGGRGSDSRVS